MGSADRRRCWSGLLGTDERDAASEKFVSTSIDVTAVSTLALTSSVSRTASQVESSVLLTLANGMTNNGVLGDKLLALALSASRGARNGVVLVISVESVMLPAHGTTMNGKVSDSVVVVGMSVVPALSTATTSSGK